MSRAPAAPKGKRRAAAGALPGDPSPAAAVARMIRVDQAGEYGAARIYEGQLAVLGGRPVGATIREMRDQEARHLETFDRLVADRRVRPTALAPLWHVAGFALGAATALLGERAAMACTVAVEEAIDAHYARQAEALDDDEAPLRRTIEDFRADELAHRDTGLAHGAKQAPGYRALHTAVGAATRLAIRLSERI
ncbi:MAG: demethoxyubiquinone hydroxylase family protein [Alphaproteobacteria bacterium]